MPIIYSYTYSPTGEGPWWGIRCGKMLYSRIVHQMRETRCFVYLLNEQNNTLAVAVEGPHSESDDIIFGPAWLLERLGLQEGSVVALNLVGHVLPKSTSIKLKPVDSTTVQGPMFIEGLTEALNQLGVLQKGLISAIVDPSVPELHQFYIEEMDPNTICLADGELRVELMPAVNYSELVRPATPEPEPEPEPLFDWSAPMVPISELSVPTPMVASFGGRGNLLGRSRLV
jgi:hypothetical protein